MKFEKYRLVIFILMFCNLSLFAQDWPDWRGTNRDGVWNETGVVEKFDQQQIPHKWSVQIGSGYSGPTVASGKVYVTDLLDNPMSTEGVLCFDEKTGKKIWEHRYECTYDGVGYPAGPRASVVINEGKAYSLGTMGDLFCFNAENGEIIWQQDLNDEYQIKMPIWGIAAAPLIYGDKIILQIGGSENACMVALDKNTGKEIWRNLDDGATYSAPIIVEKNGTEVLIVWTEQNLNGMNPENGNIYWQVPWKIRMAMAISTPVLYEDYIFVSAFFNGSLLVHLGDDYTTAKQVWQRSGRNERMTDALHCVNSTPIIIDDFIYGVDSYGELRCLELKTGDRVWEDLTAVDKDRWANIHLVKNGDKVWMFNELGELLITELSPEGLTILSRAKLIKPTTEQLPRGVTWTHPAFANKHVFIRNDNKLVCADLSD